MIVVRKNLAVEQGQQRLFDDYRYFFYLTNDWAKFAGRDRVPGQRSLQPGEPARPTQRRRAGLAGAGGQAGKQLGLHGDDGLGLELESLVGSVA